MKFAVTGAAGHIGANICRELLHQGHEVVALTYREKRAIEDLPIRLIKGDILNRESLIELMTGCDVIIHSAGLIHLGYGYDQRVYDINVGGSKLVFEVAKELGVKKIVHFSSVHAYKHTPSHIPVNEEREFVGDDTLFYDQTKRDAHKLAIEAAQNGQDISIVCPTSVVGPFDYLPSKLGKAVIDICKGSIPAVVKGGFDFVDVRDVAKGAILAAEKGRSGETYILGGKYYTIKELSNLVLQVNGSKKRLIELPLFVAYIGLPFVSLYSKLTNSRPLYDKAYIDILLDGNKLTMSDKAKKELGYDPRPLSETLKDTVDWMKSVNKI